MDVAGLAGMLNPALSVRISDGFLATDWDRPQTFDREKARLDLSLILLTRNQSANLGELLARIDLVLSGICFEAILVDEDSLDRTWAVARQFERQYPWLRVIRHRNVRGFVSGVISGFRHGRGNILALIDTNLQSDVDLLPRLLDEMDQADFAVATRRIRKEPNSKASRSRSIIRALRAAFTRWTTSSPFSDPASGFFCMRRAVFQTIDSCDLCVTGQRVLAYLYARAAEQLGRKGLQFAEIDYECFTRSHRRSEFSLKAVANLLVTSLRSRFAGDSDATARRPRWSHAAF